MISKDTEVANQHADEVVCLEAIIHQLANQIDAQKSFVPARIRFQKGIDRVAKARLTAQNMLEAAQNAVNSIQKANNEAYAAEKYAEAALQEFVIPATKAHDQADQVLMEAFPRVKNAYTQIESARIQTQIACIRTQVAHVYAHEAFFDLKKILSETVSY